MPKPSATGGRDATIKLQGHTTDGKFGSDPNEKGNVSQPPRDLKVKG